MFFFFGSTSTGVATTLSTSTTILSLVLLMMTFLPRDVVESVGPWFPSLRDDAGSTSQHRNGRVPWAWNIPGNPHESVVDTHAHRAR